MNRLYKQIAQVLREFLERHAVAYETENFDHPPEMYVSPRNQLLEDVGASIELAIERTTGRLKPARSKSAPFKRGGRGVLSYYDKLFVAIAKAGAVRAAPGWAIIGFLRSFVEKLSGRIEPIIRQKADADVAFKSKLDDLERRLGYRSDERSLAKMMSYVFMNKIIFYKVLEGKYRIPRMAALDTSSKTSFLSQINAYFERAVAETKDFEPIFRAGVYDEIDLPDEPDVLEYINEFIETLDAYDVESLGEYAGYIYEDLIEPSERHQLGQFYTPPAICELIAKWAIRGEGT